MNSETTDPREWLSYSIISYNYGLGGISSLDSKTGNLNNIVWRIATTYTRDAMYLFQNNTINVQLCSYGFIMEGKNPAGITFLLSRIWIGVSNWSTATSLHTLEMLSIC